MKDKKQTGLTERYSFLSASKTTTIYFGFLIIHQQVRPLKICNQTGSVFLIVVAVKPSKHPQEMVQQGDAGHVKAMNEMRNNMTSPEAIR